MRRLHECSKTLEYALPKVDGHQIDDVVLSKLLLLWNIINSKYNNNLIRSII